MLNNRRFCTRSEDENKTELEQKRIENVFSVLLGKHLHVEQMPLHL